VGLSGGTVMRFLNYLNFLYGIMRSARFPLFCFHFTGQPNEMRNAMQEMNGLLEHTSTCNLFCFHHPNKRGICKQLPTLVSLNR